MMSELVFSLDQIPFSMRGSWLSVSRVIGLHRRAEHVHLVSHTTGMHPVLEMEPRMAGARVAVELIATPQSLRWVADGGEVAVAFETTGRLRMRGSGLGMRLGDAAEGLTSFTGGYLFVAPRDGAAVLTSYETGRRYRITPLDGAFEVVGAELLGAGERAVDAGADGAPWEIVIEELASEGAPARRDATFDDVVRARANDFADYAQALAGGVEPDPTTALAAYVLWSATVEPAGFVGREAVLMSKHWMDKVWSWDHCFNALALAASHPESAVDQFLLPFDHQAPTGALPDSLTHSEVLYNFVKPPIHGWIWSLLRGILPAAVVAGARDEVYARLAAWTRYWLDERRAPGSDLPYYEHGNDSGWDNSTVFDADRLVESPDLAAFLVLQLDELAALAEEVAPHEAEGWRRESSLMLAALLGELRRGDLLGARSVAGHRASSTTSLLTALPILAARRLPREMVDALVAVVEEHLTEFGPATELVTSPAYTPDGYWRGPIWAPSTFIVEQGLRAAGRDELADDVIARFLRLCERGGFAENFDALTGEGLRDRAYTWTAAVYLQFSAAAAARRARGR